MLTYKCKNKSPPRFWGKGRGYKHAEGLLPLWSSLWEARGEEGGALTEGRKEQGRGSTRAGEGSQRGGKTTETLRLSMAASGFTAAPSAQHSPLTSLPPRRASRNQPAGNVTCAGDADCFHKLMRIINIKSYLLQRGHIFVHLYPYT